MANLVVNNSSGANGYMAPIPSFTTHRTVQAYLTQIPPPFWILICIMFPYTWRGMYRRATFMCPSAYMIIPAYLGFTFITFGYNSLAEGIPKNDVVAHEIASSVNIGPMFMVLHAIMILMRVRYTLTKWQGIIMCEVAKTSFVFLLLRACYLLNKNGYIDYLSGTYTLFVSFIAMFILITVVRIYWAVKCNFNAELFNNTYFGTDPVNCPMKRIFTCIACELPRKDQSRSVVVAVDKKEEQKNTMRCTIHYHTFAKLYVYGFFGTFLLGGIITFTATDYSSDKDLVYRFYGTFNPCILFDHYPSNLISMIGMICMVGGNVSSMTFLLLHSILTNPSLSTMIKWFVLFGPLFLLYWGFMNVFSTNLYEHGYKITPTYDHLNATEYSKATANMTLDEIDGISKEDFQLMATHSSWFVGWLVADITYNVLYWQYISRLSGSIFFPKPSGKIRTSRIYQKCCKKVIAFLYFFSFVVFSANVAVILFTHDGKDRWGFKKESVSFGQSIWYYLSYSYASQWFFLTAIPAQLFVMPKEVGLQVQLKLEKNDKERGGVSKFEPFHESKWVIRHIYPASLISGSFKILCVFVVATYSLKEVQHGSETVLPLASGFRQIPYRYMFTPAWIILVSIIGIGAYLVSLRETLSHRNSPLRVKWMQNCAIMFVTMMLLGIWIIIPNTKIGGYCVVIGMIVFPIFVGLAYGELHQSENERIRLGVFFVLYFVFACTSPLNPVMNICFLVFLAIFDKIIPEYIGSDGLTMILSPVTFVNEEEIEVESNGDDTKPNVDKAQKLLVDKLRAQTEEEYFCSKTLKSHEPEKVYNGPPDHHMEKNANHFNCLSSLFKFYARYFFRLRMFLLFSQSFFVGWGFLLTMISLQAYNIAQPSSNYKFSWILLGSFLLMTVVIAIDDAADLVMDYNLYDHYDKHKVFPWKFRPALLTMRAKFAAVLWALLSPETTKSKIPPPKVFLYVEILCPIATEIAPIVFAFTTYRYTGSGAYAVLSLSMTLIGCLLFTFCNIICNFWPRAAQIDAYISGRKSASWVTMQGLKTCKISSPSDDTGEGRKGTILPIFSVAYMYIHRIIDAFFGSVDKNILQNHKEAYGIELLENTGKATGMQTNNSDAGTSVIPSSHNDDEKKIDDCKEKVYDDEEKTSDGGEELGDDEGKVGTTSSDYVLSDKVKSVNKQVEVKPKAKKNESDVKQSQFPYTIKNINVKQHEQEGEIISIQVIKNDQFTTMSSIRQRKTIKPDSLKTKTSQSSGKQPFKDENNFTLDYNLLLHRHTETEGQMCCKSFHYINKLYQFLYVDSLTEKYRWPTVLTFTVIYFVTFIAMISFGSHTKLTFVVSVLTAINALVLAYILWRSMPNVIGRKFGCILIFTLFFHFFTVETGTNQNINMTRKTVVNFTKLATNQAGGGWPATNIDRFPLCKYNWGTKDHAFSTIDAVLTTILAYFENKEKMKAMANNFFQSSHSLHDVKVEKFSPQGMDGNLLHWAHLKFPSANMSVVTIRGTATALDLTVDMTFWTAITTFHQLRLFMPVLSQLPPKYIGRLIRAFFVYGLGGAPDTIYKPIIEYTRKLRTLSSEKILVVGHSLGGGIASVVASRVDGVQGFGLSPVGVFYNSLAFGFDPVYTYESFTAIIPDNDLVPIEGDKVIGMIQQIPCTANAAVCHNLNQSLVTVVKGCKDYSNPNRIWDIPGYFSKEIDLQVDPWQWKIKAEDYTAEIGEKYERSRWKAGRD